MKARRRATALALTVALTAVALAGCAATRAESAPTASTTPSSSRTPSPTPTPVAAPANVPSQPGTWIVDFDSIAGVRVGQPIASFAQSAGLTAEADTVDCPPGFALSQPIDGDSNNVRSTSLAEVEKRGTAEPDPILSLGMVSTRFAPEKPQTDFPMTAAGIRLGSTETQLLAAYPGLQKGHSKYDDTVGATTYFAGPQGGRYLVFNARPTESGTATTVDLIQTSTYPSLVDVCD